MKFFDKQPFPWAFRRAVLACISKEEKEELAAWYDFLHRNFERIEYDMITLKDDNLRLKHENEFMLRLINEKDKN